jgi:hypothetical protein
MDDHYEISEMQKFSFLDNTVETPISQTMELGDLLSHEIISDLVVSFLDLR